MTTRSSGDTVPHAEPRLELAPEPAPPAALALETTFSTSDDLPLRIYSGALYVEPEAFTLRCRRLLLFHDRAAFTLEGRDFDYGDFTVDAIARRNDEGNYHARDAAVTWAQIHFGQTALAAITFVHVQPGAVRSLDVEGWWSENGMTWTFSGTLDARDMEPSAPRPRPLPERTEGSPPLSGPDTVARLPRLGILTLREAREQALRSAIALKAAKLKAKRERGKAKAALRHAFIGAQAPVTPVAFKPPRPPKRPKVRSGKSSKAKNQAPGRVGRCTGCGARIVWVGKRVLRAHDVKLNRKVGSRHACGDQLPRPRLLQGGAFESNRRKH